MFRRLPYNLTDDHVIYICLHDLYDLATIIRLVPFYDQDIQCN